jgi:hypothetical protein
MPLLIYAKIILLSLSLVTFNLSSLYDPHWQVAEFSLSDPIYLALSLLWLGVIIWIIYDIIKKNPSVPKTITWISAVCLILILMEYIEYSTIVLVSFQSLELIIWALLILICRTESSKKWYSAEDAS